MLDFFFFGMTVWQLHITAMFRLSQNSQGSSKDLNASHCKRRGNTSKQHPVGSSTASQTGTEETDIASGQLIYSLSFQTKLSV